jgi:hypothetical protein
MMQSYISTPNPRKWNIAHGLSIGGNESRKMLGRRGRRAEDG